MAKVWPGTGKQEFLGCNNEERCSKLSRAYSAQGEVEKAVQKHRRRNRGGSGGTCPHKLQVGGQCPHNQSHASICSLTMIYSMKFCVVNR